MNQGCRVLFQEALATVQAHQLCGQATDWRRRTLLARKLHRAIQVLEQGPHVPLHRFKAAFGHLRSQYLQRFGVGKTAAQGVRQPACIDT
ncbi:hypothetical protein D3C81_1744940 [compost metagenome]